MDKIVESARSNISYKFQRKYFQSIFIQKMVFKPHEYMDSVLLKDYFKQLEKRQDYVEKHSNNQIVKLNYVSQFDYNIVATFIALQYVDYYANKLYQGQIQTITERDVIDIQYLKHLEVIVRAKYVNAHSVRASYVTILSQILNDAAQAELQLIMQTEMQTSESYQKQLVQNQTVVRSLFGEVMDETIKIEKEKPSYNENRLLLRVQYIIKCSEQEEQYQQLNNYWTELDQLFINVWNTKPDNIVDTVHNFYNSYNNFNKMISAYQQSNKSMLYDLYSLAVVRYFQVEDYNVQQLMQYQQFKNRYVEGQVGTIDGNDDYCIIDHYSPNNRMMQQTYKHDVQVVVVKQKISGQRINLLNQQNNIYQQFGIDEEQFINAKIQLMNDNQYLRQIPLQKVNVKKLVILRIVSLILMIITVSFAVTKFGKQKIKNIEEQRNNDYIIQMQHLIQYYQITQGSSIQQIQKNISQTINKQIQSTLESFDQVLDKQQPRILPIEVNSYQYTLTTWEFINNQLIIAIKYSISQLPNIALNTQISIKQLAQPYINEQLQYQDYQSIYNNLWLSILLLLIINPIIMYSSKYYYMSFLVRDVSAVYQLLQQLPEQIKAKMYQYVSQISQTRKRFAAIRQGHTFEYLDMIISNKQMDMQKLNDKPNKELYKIKHPYHYKDNRLFPFNQIIYSILFLLICVLLCICLQLNTEQLLLAKNQALLEQNYFSVKRQLMSLTYSLTLTKYLRSYFSTNDQQYLQGYNEMSNISINQQYKSVINAYQNLQNHAQLVVTQHISNIFGYISELQRLRNISICLFGNNCTVVGPRNAFLNQEEE
ncbi:Transmembrane_domain-containing protein [Hexamita inflata]|uniref:Transmembrane domain-containing protein n=1 Tax=Hexamita inflata TaxID=28002 RepID=A0AA86RI49_9EUKA|nr:Transmembrane domain-containing protein [Hexamita inflata]